MNDRIFIKVPEYQILITVLKIYLETENFM